MSREDEVFAADVARALVTAFLARGGSAPVVPDGRRNDLITVLTRCLVNPAFRRVYLAALGAESERAITRLVAIPSRDVPQDEIAQNGFEKLPDEVLADLALSSGAIHGLALVLTGPVGEEDDSPEPEEWFDEALRREEERGGASNDKPQRSPLGDKPTPPSKVTEQRNVSRVKAALVLSALAACFLLIGFGLGALVFRGGGKDDARTVAQADVSVKLQDPRGAESVIFAATVAGHPDGFVTTIVFRSGKRPVVYPDYGAPETRIGSSGRATIDSLEGTPGGAVLMFVTETPAAETVRKALAELPQNASPEVVREKVTQTLLASGYRKLSAGSAAAPEPNKP